MKLLLVTAIIHGWTPLADAAIVAEAYQSHAALPLRMRNPQMAIRRHVRGLTDGRRTLHRMVQSPTTVPVAPTIQYGKVMNEKLGYSSQSDSSPSIRSRELMPFIDGSTSDDLLVSGETDTTSYALSLAVLEVQSMSLIDASASMRMNDASSNDTNLIELLQIMPLQDSSGTIMSFENSELNFDLSMPIESNALSLSQKLTDSAMSMKINKSMSMLDSSDLSVFKISGITLELSMPAKSNSLSLEQSWIGSSMSMRFEDTFSFPIGASPGLNHLSMSMHAQDSSEMSIPIEISGMSLSMEMIETWSPSYSPTRDLELSMPFVLNESTMSSGLGELSMSMDITEMLHPTFGELSAEIDILDTVLPSNSPTHMLELIAPLKLYELSMSLDLDGFSMSMEKAETSTPSNSPTLIGDLMDTDLNEFSMSLELNDLSMSMEITETPPPSQNPSTHAPSAADSEETDEISPTQHPQVYPHPGKFVVEAEARIDLIGMYSLMDDEATAIFEQSCGSFFGDMLAGTRPLIYDAQCNVINQMLLSDRRLGPSFTRGAHRKLEEASSLLVDLIVLGNSDSDPTNYATKASDAELADLVDEISNIHSMAFLVQLKKDANEAAINDFERLTAINYIGGDDSTRVIESASESDIESNDNGMKGKVIAISSMLACGVLILGMLLSYHVIKRKRASSMLKEVDKENQRDERGEPVSPNPGSFFQDLSPRNLQEVTPKNEQLTYMYSLDDGLATPTSIASIAADSVLSAADNNMGQQVIEWTDNRIRLDIIAPPGKLGIIIDTCSEGPIVHSVKPDSPLDGLIFKGDLVIAVDDEDTREWSAHYLTKLMVSTLTSQKSLISYPFISLLCSCEMENRPRKASISESSQ